MNKKFSYSILTYRHSIFLGEVLNIGVLFIFPDENLVEFHYPSNINRLKRAYNNFNDKLIKDYLKAFENKSKKLNQKLDKYVFGYNDLISDNFLVEDASSLQFEDFRNGIYYSTAEEIREKYIQLILGDYNSKIKGTELQVTDAKIVSQLKRNIYNLNPEIKGYLKSDKQRILKNNFIEFSSDFYWKNRLTNYAKAVSFDLKEERSIIDKSLLLNGQLQNLESSKFKDVNIDFIIHEPTNSKFRDAFEEAKDILNGNQIKKEFFTDIDTYSSKVISNITLSKN